MGGELIGKGTYGCIFNPPLICRGKKLLRGPGDLGKTTRVSDAINELKIAKLLRDRPLSANYFILPEADTCVVAALEEQKDLDIDKCGAFVKGDDRFIPASERMQFKLKYGGVSLSDFGKNISSNFDFLGFCRHLLEGASLLALAGVVHYDIYRNNILVDKAEVPRYIDWGFAFVGPNITIQDLNGRGGGDRPTPGWKSIRGNQTDTESPEVTLATFMLNGYSVDRAVDTLIRGKPILRNFQRDLFFSETRQRQQLAAFVKMSDSFVKGDWAALFRTHWSKFDTWSIGCVIYEMYHSLIFSERFDENVLKVNGEKINRLLYAMLHLNPFVRADCLEALEILEPHNKILETYGKKWLAARKEQRAKTGLALS